MNQLDFINDFEAADRERAIAIQQWKVRREIIDSSPACKRVKTLLFMLADYPKPTKDERGNWLITIKIREIAEIMRLSETSVQTYLSLAHETPYLSTLDPDNFNTARTYVIHWQSILDREPARNATCSENRKKPNRSGATCPAADEEGDGRSFARGPQPPGGRGSTFEPEVPKLGTSGVQVGGQNSGVQLPHTPYVNVLEDLNTKTCNYVREELGTNPDFPLPKPLWRAWKAEITKRTLSNFRHVDQLYKIAVALGIFDKDYEFGRRHVFDQAAQQVVMNRRGESRSPIILFASNLVFRRFIVCDEAKNMADEMLRALDLYPNENDQPPTGVDPIERIKSKREQLLEAQRKKAEAEAKLAQRLSQEKAENAALEEEYGWILDSTSEVDLREAVGEKLMTSVEQLGRNAKLVRPLLLRGLKQHFTTDPRRAESVRS